MTRILSHGTACLTDADLGAQVQHCQELFRNLEPGGSTGGVVTRKALIKAFRRNRQWADVMRFPPRIKAGDGSLERFVECFMAVNTDRTGSITFSQLAVHMNLQPCSPVDTSDAHAAAQ